MKKQKILIIIGICLLLWLPLLVQARGLVPCGGYQDNGKPEAACTVNDAFYLIARATNWLIMAAGIYAVLRIVLDGFWLVTSQGNEENIKKYRGALTDAIVGFILVLLAFIIVNTLVNVLLSSKCKIDLRNPTSYLTIQPTDNNCK